MNVKMRAEQKIITLQIHIENSKFLYLYHLNHFASFFFHFLTEYSKIFGVNNMDLTPFGVYIIFSPVLINTNMAKYQCLSEKNE